MISLSWGFPKAVKNIEDALIKARCSGTIIVAAAANHGQRHEIAFPARLEDCVICIGAADGNGSTAKFSAQDPELEKYSVPGEAVLAASIDKMCNRNWFFSIFGDNFSCMCATKRYDGTSTATPIAAGIAALFIEYTRQFPNQVKDKNRHENMLKLFSRMSKEYPTETYRFLTPWSLLSEHGELWRSEIQTTLDAGNPISYFRLIVL